MAVILPLVLIGVLATPHGGPTDRPDRRPLQLIASGNNNGNGNIGNFNGNGNAGSNNGNGNVGSGFGNGPSAAEEHFGQGPGSPFAPRRHRRGRIVWQ